MRDTSGFTVVQDGNRKLTGDDPLAIKPPQLASRVGQIVAEQIREPGNETALGQCPKRRLWPVIILTSERASRAWTERGQR